jgi:hypothetical protein
MDTTIWHNLVMIGTGLAVAAYGYAQAQDTTWDGKDMGLVNSICDSLNETGLTDADDPETFSDWDGCG